MDPVSLVLGALAGGSTALASSALGEAGKDLYSTLKTLIMKRDSNFPLKEIEGNPKKSFGNELLLDEIRKQGIANDQAILNLASELLKLIDTAQPDILADLSIKVAGNHNVVAALGGIAVGPNAQNVSISKYKEFQERINEYHPNFSLNENIPNSGLPPNLGYLIFGAVFTAGAILIGGLGAFPFAILGAGIMIFGLIKVVQFYGEKTEGIVAGIVSISIPEKRTPTITLELESQQRKEYFANADVARSLREGDVGVAYLKADNLLGFRS